MQQRSGGRVQGHISLKDKANPNRGRYGEDFSRAPSQGANESREAYNQRLKEWQRRRSAGGNKAGTAKKAAPTKKKESSGNYLDRLLKGLKGES